MFKKKHKQFVVIKMQKNFTIFRQWDFNSFQARSSNISENMFNQYTSYLQALTFNTSSLHEEEVEKIVDFINSTRRRSKRHSLRVSDTLFIHENFWIKSINFPMCGNCGLCRKFIDNLILRIDIDNLILIT